MTIIVHGVNGNMDTTEWSTLGMDMAPMKVATGLQVSAAAGARQVTVGIGRSYQAGTDAINDAPVTLTLGANSSGQPRIDTVCMQVDLGGVEASAGSLVVIAGTPKATPVPATMNGRQTPGGTWCTPLAYVTVVDGKVTAFTTAEITDARPGIVGSKVTVAPGAGNWATTTEGLYVQRDASGNVEFGGTLNRTTSTVAQATATNATSLIPAGYRPANKARVTGWAAVQSAPVAVLMEISTDGTFVIIPQTGTLTAGPTAIRFDNAHWIGA